MMSKILPFLSSQFVRCCCVKQVAPVPGGSALCVAKSPSGLSVPPAYTLISTNVLHFLFEEEPQDSADPETLGIGSTLQDECGLRFNLHHMLKTCWSLRRALPAARVNGLENLFKFISTFTIACKSFMRLP